MAAPTSFPTVSRNKDTWWKKRTEDITVMVGAPVDEQNEDDSEETEYMWDSVDEQGVGDMKKTAYMWDSMDEEDREDMIDSLEQTDKWVIWKTKDKWSTSLKGRASINFFTSPKTSKTSAGDLRSKDGGERETSGSRSQKKSSNDG